MVLPKAALAVGVALLGVTAAEGAAVTTQADCFEYGYAYSGFEVATEPNVTTTHDCMRLCSGFRGCNFWSWDRNTKFCSLMASGALTSRSPRPNVVSGPRQCVFGATCFDREIDYHGYDIEKVEDRFVISAQECQQICAVNPQCAFFSWKASTYSCYLKTAAAPFGRLNDADVISGPRACPSGNASTWPLDPVVEFDPSQAPPACAEANVEYRGYTIATTSTPTAHRCQMECASDRHCHYYTWHLDTKLCQLKNADAVNNKVSDATSLRRISAAKDCIPVIPRCQFAHVGVLGASISIEDAGDYDACHFACLKRQGCTHWTIDTVTLKCTLWASFTAYTKGNGTQGLVSGPVRCESEEMCFEEGDFVGYDIEKIETGEVQSPAECQARCKDHKECHFWTWTAGSNFCYLKNQNALLGKTNDVTSKARYSGPKRCHATYGCIKVNASYQGDQIAQLSLPDYSACAAACKATPGCQSWNYIGDYKHCELGGSSSVLRTEGLVGSLAGTRDCPKDHESQVDQNCFEQGIRYTADNIVALKDSVRSASECFAHCQSHTTCRWFSYVNSEDCFLLSGPAEPPVIYDAMSISGPQACPDDNNDAFSFNGFRYTTGLLHGEESFVYSVGACANRCDALDGCKFWSYVRGATDKNCFLFDHTALNNTKTHTNAVSGEKIPSAFVQRDCTFTKPFASVGAVSPVDCQVECERYELCSSWTWSYTLAGDDVVGLCELFPLGSRQVDADFSTNSLCGSKWAPNKISLHAKLVGTEMAGPTTVKSLEECDKECVNNSKCNAFTVTPSTGACQLYESYTDIEEAEGTIAVRPNRIMITVLFHQAFSPRKAKNRRVLGSAFARSRLLNGEVKAEKISECQEACSAQKDCMYWTFNSDWPETAKCRLFNYASKLDPASNATSGSRHAFPLGTVTKDHKCSGVADHKYVDPGLCALEAAEKNAKCWSHNKATNQCSIDQASGSTSEIGTTASTYN